MARRPYMKKYLLLLLVPIALYCSGKPKIHFDTLIHDFGKQEQNAELKYTFEFKNVGDGILLIDKIQPS
jgi:hypothetical protein